MKPVVVMTDSYRTQTDQVEVIHIPLIGIEPLPVQSDYQKHHYDWLILTSKNAVDLFFKLYPDITFEAIAVIGKKTAHALEHKGYTIDYMPSEFNQEAFIEEAAQRFKNKKCCLPVSIKARPFIENFLSAQGQVDRINLYRPIASQSAADEIHAMMIDGKADVITFMSPSAVKAYFSKYPTVKIPVIAVGPVTEDALKQYGQSCMMADGATKEQMIAKIIEMREQNEF